MAMSSSPVTVRELLAPLGGRVKDLRRAISTTERLVHFVEHEDFRRISRQAQVFIIDYQELHSYMYPSLPPTPDSLASSRIIERSNVNLCLGPGTLSEIWRKLAPSSFQAGGFQGSPTARRRGVEFSPTAIGGSLGNDILDRLRGAVRAGEDAEALRRLARLLSAGKIRWLGDVLAEHRLAFGIDERYFAFCQSALAFERPRYPLSNEADALNLAAAVHVNRQNPESVWCRLLTHTGTLAAAETSSGQDPVAKEYDFRTSLMVRPLELLAYTVLQSHSFDFLGDLRVACAHLRNQIGVWTVTDSVGGEIDWGQLLERMQLLSADSWENLPELKKFINDPLITDLQEQLVLNEQSNVVLAGERDTFIAEAGRTRYLLRQVFEATSGDVPMDTALPRSIRQIWFRVQKHEAVHPERQVVQIDMRASGDGILRAVRYPDYLSVYWSSYVGIDDFYQAVRAAWPSRAVRAVVEGPQGIVTLPGQSLNDEELTKQWDKTMASLVQLEFGDFLVTLDTYELLDHGHGHVGIVCYAKLPSEGLELFERTAAFLPVMPAFRLELQEHGII